MPHHLMPNVFAACCFKQIILLDVSRNKYAILSSTSSAALAPYLGIDNSFLPKTNTIQNTTIVEKLKCDNWISTTVFTTHDGKLNMLSPSQQTGRMSANRWNLPDDAFVCRPIWINIVKAMFVLRSVHTCATKHGLFGLLQLCARAHRDAPKHSRFSKPDDYAPFVSILNWACLFYFQSIKCLEWSVALTLLCAHNGLLLKLVIGVQSFPFYAHAWSEANGIIIGDSALRRKELSVILQFPHPLLELPL